jgi:hypothetical protein
MKTIEHKNGQPIDETTKPVFYDQGEDALYEFDSVDEFNEYLQGIAVASAKTQLAKLRSDGDPDGIIPSIIEDLKFYGEYDGN